MHLQLQKSHFIEFKKGHRKWFLRILLFLAAFILILAGFWLILRAMLGTEFPFVPVSSNNMCTSQYCRDSFRYPFERTLHIGDLAVVQGVSAKNVKATYPESDVLVFHTPKQDPQQEDRLTITRVIIKEERNGIIYFRTKSDGVGMRIWPETPDMADYEWWSDYRANYTLNGMISEKLLVGKVVLRIPWAGHLVIFLSTYSGIFVVIVLIIILVMVRSAILKVRERKAGTEKKKS